MPGIFLESLLRHMYRWSLLNLTLQASVIEIKIKHLA